MTTTRKRYLRSVYQDRGLTPLQRAVLEAFDNGRGQDRVTVASHLDGQCQQLTRYSSLRAVADDALKQLNAIGLTTVDESGWHYLAEQ